MVTKAKYFGLFFLTQIIMRSFYPNSMLYFNQESKGKKNWKINIDLNTK